jgi:hypothetical protein
VVNGADTVGRQGYCSAPARRKNEMFPPPGAFPSNFVTLGIMIDYIQKKVNKI